MITQALVVQKILAFLNGELTENELVNWAEDAFVTLSGSNEDVPNENAMIEVLTYIGAADSPGFPLTWSVLSEFLEQFGTKVRVVAEASQ